MAAPMDELLVQTIDNYLHDNPPGQNFDRKKIKRDILDLTRTAIEAQNRFLSKGSKMKPPDRLADAQIAQIIIRLEPVVYISSGAGDGDDDEYGLFGVYESSGPNEGTYNTSERALDKLIRKYNRTATGPNYERVREFLKQDLKVTQRCMDRDLIAVNNGIFNYKTKILQPFTPDLIFTSKSRVNYNPNARNVVIHNPDDNTDWDVESWMSELSDDPKIVDLLWEIQGAIIRPYVRWDKSAWLYSVSGNSGKGTLCELMRNLCGRKNYASIALSDFSKDFMLEPLVHSSAIIVDENDVGVYLDRVANLKAVITNDVLLINRKFKEPISYQFFGFMVQCLNEYPRVKDTSDSFYRRQLFIPFDKCFTGRARKYIKDDYLNRPEVLEYVLFKVLNMDYYELSEPESCKAVLADYKEYNNPISQFVEEVLPETRWGVLPFTFLYDLYKEWFAQNCPSGKVQGRNTFNKDIADMAQAGKLPGFTCLGRKVTIRPKNLMDDVEPLIVQYNLTNWMNPNYKGPDIKQICRPVIKATYRGLVRMGYEKDVMMPPSTTQASGNELEILHNVNNEVR